MSNIKRFLNDQIEGIRELLGAEEHEGSEIISEDNSFVIIRCPTSKVSNYLGSAISWLGIAVEIKRGLHSKHEYIRAHLQTL